MSTKSGEDLVYDIYHKIRKERIKIKFHLQLDKMNAQPEYMYKSIPERWEYAYSVVSNK